MFAVQQSPEIASLLLMGNKKMIEPKAVLSKFLHPSECFKADNFIMCLLL